MLPGQANPESSSAQPKSILLTDCADVTSYFRCGDNLGDDVIKECVPVSKRCDAVWDCVDGSDESVETCGGLHNTRFCSLLLEPVNLDRRLDCSLFQRVIRLNCCMVSPLNELWCVFFYA